MPQDKPKQTIEQNLDSLTAERLRFIIGLTVASGHISESMLDKAINLSGFWASL